MSRLFIHLNNIYRLGVKELISLWADKTLLLLIIWAFTGSILSANSSSDELKNAPVAIVDQDHSQLSYRMQQALLKPYFKKPAIIGLHEMDESLDRGYYSFAIVIPPSFQRDLEAGRHPEIQVNIDATVMSQAFIGSGYINNIFTTEINSHVNRENVEAHTPIELATRVHFNPNLIGSWFSSVMEIINNINMLTIILVGAAYIREREHGTLEHLLAMPINATEIMLSKIWANGLAVLIGSTFALIGIVKMCLNIPYPGSTALFILATIIYLFAAASIGIFLGTLSRTMPQLGLLIFLTIIPLQLLSGSSTPQESMPVWVQNIMQFMPTTYFVRLAQSILFRSADFINIWPDFACMSAIGIVFFFASLSRFRKSVTQ